MVIYIRLIESVGPFICPEGYVVVDKPDVTAAEWAALLDAPQFKWGGLRLAHVFPDGWATASFHSKADDPGFFVFYYKDIGQYLTHDLHLDEHGITKSWVIISKN